ncbi:thermonuclease family protein [Agrobacterium vitis]|uniref:thermonuclease family protein n=1 Tax=Allorhizobium ampelinum TaxID=3025782 RepID=UPI001F44FF62|nr:thermonuclease family protein [Allorhizobium ampelinum]MCF1450514.1 thermonuclease family protein [Allorhizobium ampelinum]
MTFKFLAALAIFLPSSSFAADIATAPLSSTPPVAGQMHPGKITGRANAVDGLTLWFPHSSQKVRFKDLDACELPQWALDPKWINKSIQAPNPVPCGAIAKAWLKRSIGAKSVTCTLTGLAYDGTPLGVCKVGNKDLAQEMIRVGWARVITPYPSRPSYLSYQQAAMSARYGMWATYVLDMDEWRRRSVDKTDTRQPYADQTLINTRQSEISPPFVDARQRPLRTDR